MKFDVRYWMEFISQNGIFIWEVPYLPSGVSDKTLFTLFFLPLYFSVKRLRSIVSVGSNGVVFRF